MCGLMVYAGKKENLNNFEENFKKLRHRGPDDTEIVARENVTFAFHRLAIMDLTSHGNQPFHFGESLLVCNGEIYNYKILKEQYQYDYTSKSDCEVIIPVYQKLGIYETAKTLDGEFAFVLFDEKDGLLKAARDPMGIRPLFYGYDRHQKIMFASEIKVLTAYCEEIKPFPPGHIFDGKDIICYEDLSSVSAYSQDGLEDVCKNIFDKLVAGVKKRLVCDAPYGFLLSGGLDSSLVCAIAQKHSKNPIKTFAIGMREDAIDLKYAQQVADYIGCDHTAVYMTPEEVLASVKTVIYHLETWDITTIRASIGMYLVCKYVKEQTKLKVLLTGEVSDELLGYKYTDFAPSAEEFQQEAAKRIRELYIYDVLRADRCISANSLEARVPFSDTDFVKYVMSINPALKMNTYGHGKYLLRKAFDGQNYLPHDLLFREKAAFSDAVGHSMVDILKAEAEKNYSDSDVQNAKQKYSHGTPFTKESLWYRDIFEEFYPNRAQLIKDFWMPNQTWPNCQVTDPSARVLANYGKSGK